MTALGVCFEGGAGQDLCVDWILDVTEGEEMERTWGFQARVTRRMGLANYSDRCDCLGLSCGFYRGAGLGGVDK